MKEKGNCFDILRYWGSLSIMLLHFSGYMMIRMGSEAYTLSLHKMREVVSYYPGLVILFMISGFFGAWSLEKAGSVKVFLKKKAVRIFPELWICMAIMLLIGILLLGTGVFGKSVLGWILIQGIGISFTPGTLKTFGTGSFNGTLWTIFVQIQFYLILSVTWKFVKERISKKTWIFILFPVLIILNVLSWCLNGHWKLMDMAIERSIIPYLLWFAIGVFGYLFREDLEKSLKIALCPLILTYAVCMFFYRNVPSDSLFFRIWECGYYTGVIRSVLCGFTFLALGIRCVSFVPAVRFGANISYELFLYHWIMLNIILHLDLYDKWGWGWCLVLFLLGTVILSVVSKMLLKAFSLEKNKNVEKNA